MIISVLTDQWVSSSLSPACETHSQISSFERSADNRGLRQLDSHKVCFFFHIPTDAALKKRQKKKQHLENLFAQGLLDGVCAVWFAFKRKAKIASYYKHTNEGLSLLSLIDGHGVWNAGEAVKSYLLVCLFIYDLLLYSLNSHHCRPTLVFRK